ncbi:MAG: SHOCT domain-containing protein [Clostridiales bacterium]|nr:SHOCT domain-containing protein [Clostridiales bacterium]
MAIVLIVFALHLYAVKKNSCVITNKRIKGTACIFLGSFLTSSTYSYRLDEINNVEIGSALGVHTLVLVFTQGVGLRNVFRVSYISNYEEAYNKLTELLCTVKNDKDLYADIEAKKIEAENKQAAALERIVNTGNVEIPSQSSSNADYITQLKGLKELLDTGIITQEEFDMKKKTLLM